MFIARTVRHARFQLAVLGVKAPVTDPREPRGPRPRGDDSPEVLVEPAAGIRILHLRGKTLNCEPEPKTLARVILARILGEDATVQAHDFVRDFAPAFGMWRCTEAQIVAWSARQRTE